MLEKWNPCSNLIADQPDSNYAVVILNCSIGLPPNILLRLWQQATVKVTVDGGTVRWLKWLKLQNVDLNNINPPDLITGDMDSLSKDDLETFTKIHTVKVVRTPDQNETDFTKALRELKEHCTSGGFSVQSVYVLADTSGRFDHIIANINTLYKAVNILPESKVFQVATNSITWLLREGKHSIEIPEALRKGREWCALMAFNSASNVTTTGLKWNLNNTKMEFGGLLSTSNTYEGIPTVTVTTDRTVVWSMGIKLFLESI